MIDQSLFSAHEMSVCVDGGLKGPYSLWYDQSRRRLCIGEGEWDKIYSQLAAYAKGEYGWDAGRVIVIDNLKDFSTIHVGSRI